MNHKRRILQREIQDMILKGSINKVGYTTTPKQVVAPIPPTKLHLNIRLIKNVLYKIKQTILHSRKNAKGGSPTKKLVRLGDFVDVAKIILGYGIIGSLLLCLLMLFLPLHTPISEAIKTNIWLEIVVCILGSGSFFYLYFDLSGK